MNKVRFGIIGTGMIASLHAKALSEIPEAEVIAAFNPQKELAERFASEHPGVEAFSSLDDLFELKELDAVTIATPSGSHAEGAIAAAHAGKHVFCEKPLDITVERAEAIVDAAHRTGVLLAAVYPSRYTDGALQIEKAVRENRFGDFVLAGASVRWYRPPEYYKESPWRGTWRLDGGGALMNQGIHSADLLLHFCGDLASVQASAARRMHKEIEVEDTLCAKLCFRNGALGYLEASTACPPGFERRIEISGTRGSVVLENDRITRWSFSDCMEGDEKILANIGLPAVCSGGADAPGAIDIELHKRQLREFIDAIRNHAALRTPGSEGVRAVRMICGIYEAARTGNTVQL